MRVFSTAGLRLFKSKTSKREIIYDFQPGSSKRVFLVIHGLGDDMTKIEGLAERAVKDGYGILRLDLHGHGLTLRRYLKTHNDKLPDELDYADNISDIQEMIASLRIDELVIVGHSYGGGISYGLAAALAQTKNSAKVISVHMLAPYVQRIDKFLSDYFQSPQFLMDKTAESIGTATMNSGLVKNIMDPFFSMMWTMTSGMRFMKDYTSRLMMVDKTKDLVMDPWIETFMRKSYRQYFIMISQKSESELNEADLKLIDLQVEASIRVTKGIRSFDLLDLSTALPMVQSPIQVIGGKHDQLVVPAQLQDFDRRLTKENFIHELDFVEGENSHHLFPRLMVDQVYEKIHAFVEKIK